MARDADAVDHGEQPEGRRLEIVEARIAALEESDGGQRKRGEQQGEKRQPHERMRDRAMVFHDRQRIVMREFVEAFVEDVDIGEDGAERGRENRHSLLAVGEKSLAEERACNAVCYRVHEGSERGKVYTIRPFQATAWEGFVAAQFCVFSRRYQFLVVGAREDQIHRQHLTHRCSTSLSYVRFIGEHNLVNWL